MIVNPYEVINSVYDTEKSQMLRSMKNDNRKTIKKFEQEKHVFLIRRNANKDMVKKAIEMIYDVKVDSVNTIILKPKAKKSKNKKLNDGKTEFKKKAIVTLLKGQTIDLKMV